MTTIDLTNAAGAAKLATLAAGKATARCDECGCNWEIHRGDAFHCPFCAATFTVAHLGVGGSYVQLEGSGGACTSRR